MTDFLIIDNIPVPVADGTFKENPSERGGSESRSYAGNLRSTVRWEKRSWSFTTGHMEKAEGDALAAAVALDLPVIVSGSALAVSCRVTIGERSVINAESSDTNHWVMQYNITMREA